MSRTTTIYTPCDVVGVRITYRNAKFVSPIELAVLEAIALGQHGTEQIAELLSLNDRIVLDVVSDLWRRSYVVLDFARGEVRLSDAVTAHATAGTLDKLAGIERDGAVTKIMYDRLSGHVLPRGGLRSPADYRLAVPVEGSGDSIEAASPAELLAAVQQSVDEVGDGMGIGKEVVSAQLSPVELREPTGRMWLPLDVRVGDSDGERLRVSVLGTTLPLARRQQAAQRLARLAEEYPGHSFVQALRAQADPEYEEPPPLDELACNLTSAAAETESARPGTRRQSHQRLRRLAGQIADELADRVASEVHAVPLYDRATMRDAARKLVEQARSQVVLVAATLRLNGFGELIEPLRAARRRGVQIVVVWGRGWEQALDHDVSNALHLLAGRAQGGDHPDGASEAAGPVAASQVLWSSRSARVNVSAVVCDDRAALVTGDALFASSGTGAPLQLGLRIAAPGDGRCQPIERLLEWASEAVPEYRVGQAVDTRYEHFHLDAGEPDLAADTIRAEVLAEIPDEPQEDEDDVSTADTALWADSWSAAAARISGLVGSRTSPGARLVVDGSHVDLLWHGLTTAASRLVIGVREVDPVAVNSKITRALQECAARGAAVTIVHDALQERLGALEDLSAAGDIALSQRATGARFVISDSQIAVGSFGYLSLPGRSGSQGPRLDLSLLLSDPVLVDRVAARFTSSGHPAATDTNPSLVAPSADQAVSGIDDDGTTGLAARQARRLLDDVREAANTRARSSAVREALAGEANPWPVIGYLRDSGAPGEIIRVAVASSWERPGPGADDHRAWLIEDLWRTGQFTEAAVLRDGVPDEQLRPRRALTEVAAVVGAGASAEALQSAALSSPSPAEAIAIAVACAAELLLGPGPAAEDRSSWDGGEIAEALRVVESQLAEPWQHCVRQVRVFWSNGKHPLPVTAIQRGTEVGLKSEATRHAWLVLDEALERGASVRFRAYQGNKAHDLLFQADRPFGQLRAAAASRDFEAVCTWIAEPALRDLGTLLDSATAEASTGAPLVAGPRRASLARLTAIVKAARDVAAGAEREDTGIALIPDDARQVAADLHRRWSALEQAAGEVPAPEVYLVRAVLARLAPIAEWGRA